jgi:hypothetical protein
MVRSKTSTLSQTVDAAGRPWRAKLRRGFWILTAIVLLFSGLLSLAVYLRHQLRPLDLYSLRFERIDCPDPPGRKHQEFLGEVRYLGQLPEKLTILDENTVQRVAGAFGKHPWVERVIRVDLDLGRPRVQLIFRTPVLTIAQEENGTTRVRVVDRHAMLLPADASGRGLPRYWARGDTAMDSAGQCYVDVNVKSAASTADYLHDFLVPWHIVTVQADTSGVDLASALGTRILWGHAPGLELTTEARAARKRDWLRAYFESRGAASDKSSPALVDVRGPTAMTVLPIPVAGATP